MDEFDQIKKIFVDFVGDETREGLESLLDFFYPISGGEYEPRHAPRADPYEKEFAKMVEWAEELEQKNDPDFLDSLIDGAEAEEKPYEVIDVYYTPTDVCIVRSTPTGGRLSELIPLSDFIKRFVKIGDRHENPYI